MYCLNIDAVDGETSYHLKTDFPLELRLFLKKYDHEGSSISLTIEAHGESVYEVVDSLSMEWVRG